MNKFTIIDPANQKETSLHFEKNAQGNLVYLESENGVIIDNQQLYELGVLFIALAGDGVDYDAANELLSGFDISDLPVYNFAVQFVVDDK